MVLPQVFVMPAHGNFCDSHVCAAQARQAHSPQAKLSLTNLQVCYDGKPGVMPGLKKINSPHLKLLQLVEIQKACQKIVLLKKSLGQSSRLQPPGQKDL